MASGQLSYRVPLLIVSFHNKTGEIRYSVLLHVHKCIYARANVFGGSRQRVAISSSA